MHALKALILAASTIAALAGPAVAQSRVAVELAWRQSPLAPGQEAVLGVVLDIADGWHLQAGKGSGDDVPPYIPTTIDATLPDGWVASTPIWPDAHDFRLGVGAFAESLRGYEGRMLVALPVRIPEGAETGSYGFEIEVGYQACDDQVCEMPTSVAETGTIEVAPPGTAGTAPPDATLVALFEATLGRAGATAALDADEPRTFADGERLQAELHFYEVEPVSGRDATLGVLMHAAPGWHVQAGKGSGDDAPPYIPTSLTVRLPDGWTSGETRWPEAHSFVLGSGAYAETLRGYEGTFLAVVPVEVPGGVDAGTYPVAVAIAYQACDDMVCEMPATLEVESTVKVIDAADAAATPPLDAALAARFKKVLERGAGDEPGSTAGPAETEYVSTPRFAGKHLKWWIALLFVVAAMAWMTLRTFAITPRVVPRAVITICALLMVTFSATFAWHMTTPTDLWRPYSEAAFDQARAEGKRVLLKFTAEWCANCHVNERIITANDEAVAELTRADTVAMKVDLTGTNEEGEAKKEALGGGGIPLIAVYQPDSAEPILIRGIFASADPVIAALHGERTMAEAGGQLFDFLGWQFSVGSNATLIILVLAFLAGFFLNFTPCVLPVIPLKIMSLQAHAKDPRRCFVLGLIFGLGIVAAFAVLGVLIAGFIGGIERMDWGGMFSYWWFSGLLGVVVGAMGLGMLGLFVMQLPQFVYMFDPRSDTASGSFFMGIFTAVLSTPCTGPLLGATIAWVLLQPKWLAFMTFVVMGAGMAFPYVLLTANPAWLDRLPRTGPGSELVKQVMGLLLLAVATFFVGIAVESLVA